MPLRQFPFIYCQNCPTLAMINVPPLHQRGAKKIRRGFPPLSYRTSAPVTKFVTHLTDSFSPYLHHLTPIAIGICSYGYTRFSFFDRTKNNLVIHITNLMPGALDLE